MIHVISGPPCSGKSTYVRENAKNGDLRIDYDLIAQALGSVNSHAAEGIIKQAAFDAREGAIKTALKNPEAESWIIHTSPSEKHMRMYEAAGAEFIELDPGYEVCMERAERDNRPANTINGIERWYQKGRKMNIKTKTFEIKAQDNGTISGYASTWIREPDAYGDIVAKGAFAKCIERLKAEGKVLPLLFNHKGDDLESYIGTVFNLAEDDHGLKFDAAFDATPESQRARELAATGRLVKFSFSYDVLDQATVTLEDGREANELRELEIHEISLVLYPANRDTGIISVKSGRRNSAKDEAQLNRLMELAKEVIEIVSGLLAEDIEPEAEESSAKSEDLDPDNDKERERIEQLVKEAEKILSKGETK